MSSRHIDAQCAGKIAHRTRDAAIAHKKGLIRRHGRGQYNTYQCEKCGKWHVGHANKYKAMMREKGAT